MKVMNEYLLEVQNLKKYFPIRAGLMKKTVGYVKAVDDVSFSLRKGETLGLVGESGCGKSTTGRSILRLFDITSGKVYFQGNDLMTLKREELRRTRKKFQMVFQDPYASLDPRMTVYQSIAESIQIHNMAKSGWECREMVVQLLEDVGLKAEYMDRYPFEFSGGQRQRIGIARALAVKPALIVADEPVSALDVSIQAQVINLMKNLKKQYDLTYIFIAHDLSVVKHISDRVAVMYLGRIVEIAEKKELFENPKHPYTKALLSAVPVPDPFKKKEKIVLKGDVPSPLNPPSGCHFHPRCPYVMDVCSKKDPKLIQRDSEHCVACHLYDQTLK